MSKCELYCAVDKLSSEAPRICAWVSFHSRAWMSQTHRAINTSTNNMTSPAVFVAYVENQKSKV